MKKNIYILLALLLGLSLTTCKKDAVPDKLIVNAEVKEVTTNSVIIEGSYEYSMEITEFEMFYSTTDDMNGSQSVKITPEGNDFSVELTDLEDNTQYYFNFVFTGEYNSTTTEEVCDFKTLEVKTPTLTTNNISNIMETTAECGGNVTDDGGGTVTERGICWSTSHYPSVMDNRTKNGGGTGAFTAKMTNLKPNTKYYVRAYATNEKGTNYGAEKGFTTRDVVVELPTVTTKTVSEITATTARSGGNVTDDGGGTVTARGVCWSSTSSSPKVNDSHTIDGKGTGSFYSTLTNLNPNTTYYVRAYAINEKGTVYGPLKSFTTLDDGSISVTVPTVTTRNVTAITANSATCGGTVTDEGGATVTARGVCWGISPNPTIDNLYDESTVDGDGAGSFISQLTNLKENTTYYVRAYATNNVGTSYGEEFTFTTLQEEGWQEPTGSINGYDYIDLGLPSGLKWATCNIGANSPEEYGNYYAWGETETKTEYTDENCLTNNLYIEDISGSFQYDAAMANWGGSWRMPAKAEYEELMSQCSFEYVKYNGIDGLKLIGPNGNYIFFPAAGHRDGNNWYNSGIDYWSSTNNYSTAYVFSYIMIPNIEERVHRLGYPIRPVSGMSEVTTPTVITYPVDSETATTAICNAEVQSDGGSFVTARGFCYSRENVHPSLLDSEFTIDGSGTGSFSSQLTNLAPNTLYYVRAYATNYVGTSYGENVYAQTVGETTTDIETDAEGNEIITLNGVVFKMIKVEGGTFQMGAQSTDPDGANYDSDAYDSESPVHSVTLSDYYIGETEVTQELWQAVMGSNPSNFKGSNKPVECVSWHECKEFITKLNNLTGKNFRLPTEAEWEFAARGGNESKGYKYSGSNNIDDVAWYGDNSASETHDVKTKSPNELGIYDMSGNVYEWCEDWYGSYSSGSQTNPTGPSSGSYRVLRGGSWINFARICRVSIRDFNFPGSRYNDSGFRLVLQELQ